MCYNCGCQLPHNPMGKDPVRKGGPSLTEEDLQEMADKKGMSLEDVKSNIYQQLGCNCKDDYPSLVKKSSEPILSDHLLEHMSTDWGMSVEETKHNICDLLCITAK